MDKNTKIMESTIKNVMHDVEASIATNLDWESLELNGREYVLVALEVRNAIRREVGKKLVGDQR